MIYTNGEPQTDIGEVPYMERTSEVCPNCKVGMLLKGIKANGPDDYDYYFECPKCGYLFD